MRDYYRRSPGVASRVVDGEAVLAKMPGMMLYVLNGAAARMWVRADGTRSRDELVPDAAREPGRCFLDRMVELELLLRIQTPLEAADRFPQDVDWPDACVDVPEILASEPVEARAGPCSLMIDGNQITCGHLPLWS